MGDLPIGSIFAGYRIEGIIGRGGMGVVYLAEHLRLKVNHALKVVAPEHADDPEFVERFLREAQLAASLDHPNVIPIYGADEVQGTLFIAMRYVRGTDLRNVLDREGVLDPDRALSFLDQVGSALDAAHAEGLVHRDVKPANILIAEPTRPGSTGKVFLTDFGLTKRVDSGTKLTRTGFYVGTLHYSAPEQLTAKPLDGRTDQYALAAVLFECLAGSPPFEREMDAQVIAAHLADDPPSLSALRPELPAGIDPVIARGMAKAKEDRYSDCASLLGAARDALSSTQARSARPRTHPATRYAPPPAPKAVVEPPPMAEQPTPADVADVAAVPLTPEAPAASAGPKGSTIAADIPATLDIPPAPSHSERPDRVVRPPEEATPHTQRKRLWIIVSALLVVGGLIAGVVVAVHSGGPHVTDTIRTLGRFPEGATFGDGAVWVANGHDNTVSRIDATSGRVTGAPIRVGKVPKNATFGAGAVWVANSADNTVSRIEPATNQVTTIRLPAGTSSPNGATFGEGAVWIVSGNPPEVSEIDPATNTVTATVPVGKAPKDATFGDGAVWVASSADDTVWRIDATTRNVIPIKVGSTPGDATFGDGAVWVPNSKDNTVSRIDATTNKVTAIIKVGLFPDAATFGEGSVWVANGNDNTVSRIQP